MKLKDVETIQRNLEAFVANFEQIWIEPWDYGRGFDVYRVAPKNSENGHCVQSCPNIDYLDGWLYGCVQAKYMIKSRDEVLTDSKKAECFSIALGKK